MSRHLFFVVAILLSLAATGVHAQGLVWGGNTGRSIINAQGNQANVVTLPLLNGKIAMAWEDNRGTKQGVYYTVVDQNGANGGGQPILAPQNYAQRRPAMMSDGIGGFYCAWEGDVSVSGSVIKDTSTAIYIMRFDGSGFPVSSFNNGFPLLIDSGKLKPQSPVLVAGGIYRSLPVGPSVNSVFLFWTRTNTSTFQDIYAQRVTPVGTVALTPPTGEAICVFDGKQQNMSGVADTLGGCYVVWMDFRPAASFSIYGQHLDSAGVASGGANGKSISAQTKAGGSPQTLQDGQGGAVVVWTDGTTTPADSNIMAQRVNNATNQFNLLWPIGSPGSPVTICGATGNQTSPALISDSAGGFLTAWQDKRNGGSDIYAARWSMSGQAIWTGFGKAIDTSAGDQTDVRLAPSGGGGAIASWTDNRSGTSEIYAQHVDQAGTRLWDTAGVEIGSLPSSTDPQTMSVIVSAYQGGYASVFWIDSRNIATTGTDIYGSRVGFMPKLHLSVSSLDFGTVRTRSIVVDTIHLSNTGTDSLTVTGYSFTGPSLPADGVYQVTAPVSTPFTLAPGADSAFAITYRPAKNTANIDTLIIHTSSLGVDSLHRFPLTGLGKYPHLTLSIDTILFGSVRLNTTSTKKLVIHNVGTDTAHILDHSVAGAFFSEFIDTATAWQTAAPFYTIAPGDSLTLSVTVTPFKLGAKTAQEVLTTDDSVTPLRIQLTAKGIFPNVKLLNPILTFGQVRKGDFKILNSFVVNSGTDTLHVDSITVGGPDAVHFSFLPAMAFPVAVKPGDTMKLTAQFSPAAEVAYNGIFKVYWDGQDTAIYMSGRGSNYTLQVQQAVIFGEVTPPLAPDSTVTIQYSGPSSDLVVILQAAIVPPGTKFSFGSAPVFPMNVGGGKSASFDIRYTPDSTGFDTAYLAIVVRYGAVGSAQDTFLVYLQGGKLTSVFESIGLPTGLTLDQSYPNPVHVGVGGNDQLTIGLNVEKFIPDMELGLYNMVGQKLQSLYRGTLQAGVRRFAVNVSSLSAGSYIYRLVTRDGAISRVFSVVR